MKHTFILDIELFFFFKLTFLNTLFPYFMADNRVLEAVSLARPCWCLPFCLQAYRGIYFVYNSYTIVVSGIHQLYQTAAVKNPLPQLEMCWVCGAGTIIYISIGR